MKTKVIAFRVTQDEYDALYFAARQTTRTVAEVVYDSIRGGFPEAIAALAKERKRLEAKPKRDPKKAAANGAQ